MGYISLREFRVVENNKHIIYKTRLNCYGQSIGVLRDNVPCTVEEFNKAGALAVELKLLKAFHPVEAIKI